MSKAAKTYELKLEKTLNAPVERVWKALSEGKQIPSWYGPADEFRVEVHQWDCKPGGKYRVSMHAPDGKTHICIGVFKEIKPNQRLSYTWSWEGQDPMDTLVAFDLKAAGKKTDLVFLHTGFTTEQDRDNHEMGWSGSMERLGKMMA